MTNNPISMPKDALVFKVNYRLQDLKTGHTYHHVNEGRYIARNSSEIEKCLEDKRAEIRAKGLDLVDICIWAINRPIVIGKEGVIELYAFPHSLKIF